MTRCATAVIAIDPTLEGAARSTFSRMQDDLQKLQAKIIQAAKRKDETLRRQFRHAQARRFRLASRKSGRSDSSTFSTSTARRWSSSLSDVLPGEIGHSLRAHDLRWRGVRHSAEALR